MAEIKKLVNSKSWLEDRATEIHNHCWREWYNCLEYSLAVSYKVKHNLPYDPEIVILGVYPRKMKSSV